MQAFSNFKLTVKGSLEETKAIFSLLSGKLSGLDETAFLEAGVIQLGETYDIVWLEDFEDLAVKMAKAAPGCEFFMEGTSDATQSSGELLDFEIEYKGGKLTARDSGWYGDPVDKTYYDCDFECFCEEIEADPENPPISEEKWDELDEFDPIFIVGEGENLKVITDFGGVPLGETRKIPIK